MDLLSNGTKLARQDLITFLFESAADLLQELDGFLVDAVIHRPLAQKPNQLDAAVHEEKEQLSAGSDHTCLPKAQEMHREDDRLARPDLHLHEINLAIEDLRNSLVQTRFELAEACNRADQADRLARQAVDDLARLRERGLLARLLGRNYSNPSRR